MAKEADPWGNAVGAWVKLSDMLASVERELGISPAQAAKVLRPALENLQIQTRVPALPDVEWHALSRHGLIEQWAELSEPSVSLSGWQVLGSDGRLDGELAGWPVWVKWAQVEEALAHLGTPIAPAKRSPRSPAGLNYADSDKPLLAEMRTALETGAAKSRWDAALKVADRAAGYGNPMSRAKRLSQRFSAAFSSERDGED